MAKKKHKRNPPNIIKEKRFNLKFAGQPRDKSAEDERLGLLAKELGIAGMTVLVNDFGFSQDNAQRWLELMIAQAKATRSMINAKIAYEQERGAIEDDT